MKIAFISDFFLEEMHGGAEIVDDFLIKKISFHHDIVKKKSDHFSCSEDYDLWIISNFTHLAKTSIEFLKSKRYIIIEHDHKFSRTRDVSKFPKHLIPADQVINSAFYRKAELIFCQSQSHATTTIDNLLLDNVANFGCSFWSNECLDLLENLSETKKVVEYAFLESTNPIKGSFESKVFCTKNNLNYKSIQKSSFDKVMCELSQVEKFVFFPQVMESFCRLATEARMVNCSLITNNNLGCASEEWFLKLKGLDLINFIRQKQQGNLDDFIGFLSTGKTKLKIKGKKIPKVSIITSMFKAGKFIDRFLSNIVKQTIFENCELIIVDAASPEGEVSLINEYKNRFKNIKYLRLDSDPGIYGCWNEAIKIASGKYITNANLDDLRFRNQIEVMINSLEKNPDIDLVYAETFITKDVFTKKIENIETETVYPTSTFSPENMVKCLPGCMPVWRKSMHDKSGLFDESLRYAGDHEMWLRAVRAGSKFKKIDGVYGAYLFNEEGLTTSKKTMTKKFIEEKKVFWEYSDVFGLNATNKFREYFSK
tara:strand:- start:7569 stop:9185 length:1617 start_codon:yes stop_codon:yes gene_type:complete